MFLPILVGVGAMLGSLLCYGMATALILRVVARLFRSGYAGGFWAAVANMMVIMLITALAHLVQIAIWSMIFLICGEMPTLEKAFYLSAQNYTSLGYRDL